MASSRSHLSRPSRRLKNEINVVPYIDVMLVLLVIFMVTAPMITPGLIELPTVGRASDVPVEPVEVQIQEDGSLAIRSRSAGSEFEDIPKDGLVDAVRTRISNETPVVIAADGKVPYEQVMAVMDQLRSNGVTRLGLLVDQGASEVTDNAPLSQPSTPPAEQN
ncbi:protein TolR [Pusillimonas sp. DMV24BSW_D]|uniref:protein TolR n=1 Tax=Neopusillimonas aestuarii TaxID=2716226 RepID=UPI00140A616C|nr:protein TolR [Pusillimonas sp. DMV24BSW_D]QIM50200.1 protein TolR [Pusillimonas sp. DMV24BSW_D]